MNLLSLVSMSYFILGCLFTGTDAGLLDSLGGTIGIGVNTNRPQNPTTNNYNTRPNNNRFQSKPIEDNDLVYDEVINSNDESPAINQPDRKINTQGNRFPETTSKKNVVNRPNLELTDKELIAVQKYPELQNLLNKLKEMNRQKELEKQKNQNKPSNSDGTVSTQTPVKEVKDKNGWVKLKKRKIFFKAKPVRPDNEMVPKDIEEIYYLD